MEAHECISLWSVGHMTRPRFGMVSAQHAPVETQAQGDMQSHMPSDCFCNITRDNQTLCPLRHIIRLLLSHSHDACQIPDLATPPDTDRLPRIGLRARPWCFGMLARCCAVCVQECTPQGRPYSCSIR
jgi:hypothetical protein